MIMSHRERIEAVIRGERADQTPIALWRHFPIADENADELAKVTIDYQRKFDFDLVKVTPASGYPAEAWGGQLENRHSSNEGTREYTKRVVQRPEDWLALQPLDVLQGVWARELKALERIRAGVGDDVHVLQTIFNPLTIGKQLSGPLVLEHMRQHPDSFQAGMRVVSETTARFAIECLRHGADGIFFATQYASLDMVTESEYRKFGIEFDMPVLDAIAGDSTLTLLHLHGTRPIFELANQYPVDIVNWHDCETEPSLSSGHQAFSKGAVLGGLDRSAVMETGSPGDVARQVQNAKSQVNDSRLIIGTGCVSFITTPEENIRAAIDAARSS